MQAGLVTTIIPVFNRPQMLGQAVSSVLDQSYRNIEIIIIDDGSTDNTLSVAQALAEQHSAIRVFSIENTGPALARQRGLEAANGEFIQYLDSDDLLHKDKFSKQITALKQYPEIGVSYCIQELCDSDGNTLDPAWMRSGEHFETMFPAMLGGRIWGTPVPIYRANLLKRAGPWLNLRNQEDWEYDCRVASLGVKLHYCPETLVTIRRHEDDHFGQLDDNSHQKIIDKSKAYLAIYQHSTSAEIAKDNTESRRFNRMAFMLARQCASLGKIDQSKKLMSICKAGTDLTKRKIEYKLYTIVSSLFGWKAMGRLSNIIDRCRP